MSINRKKLKALDNSERLHRPHLILDLHRFMSALGDETDSSNTKMPMELEL